MNDQQIDNEKEQVVIYPSDFTTKWDDFFSTIFTDYKPNKER